VDLVVAHCYLGHFKKLRIIIIISVYRYSLYVYQNMKDEDERGMNEDDDEVNWPPPQPRPVDISRVELRERRGRAYVRYRSNAPAHRSSRSRGARGRVQSAGDFDRDYDSASDSSVEDLNENVEYSVPQLAALQASSANVYKRSVFNIDSSRCIYARPLDHSYPKILITARKLCGRAFHGDEVLVEIIDFGKKLGLPKSILGSTVDRPETSKPVADLEGPWAKVVGVFKRAMEPKYRMFVCQVEEGNNGIMVPLNRGIPKIFNLERHDVPAEESKVMIYAFTRAKQIIFDRYQKVHDVNSLLFVVRYLKWEDRCSLPLGIVVSVLPPGVTLENAMAILHIEYSIPRRFREATETEVRLKHSAVISQFPPGVLGQRRDYRSKLVFTIDPPNARDLDDALSFEELPGGKSYVIGIHISDVSYFVSQASSVDCEARQRGSSFYTALDESTPMLPARLSEDLCSLLPSTDRLTLSVYIKVNAGADILSVEIKRSIVRSRYRLCYSEAEAIINGTADDSEFSSDLTSAIMFLNRVAQLWRYKRLGREALYNAVDYSTLDGPKAHKLVEELMIAANCQVAAYLLSKFPSYTALRCQSPPDVTELEDWKTTFLTAARHSVVLSRPYCAAGDVCQCTELCECLPSVNPQLSDDAAANDDRFEVMTSIWPLIQQAASEYDSERLHSLVISPEFHPHQAVALFSYHLIQDRSVYRCSGELESDLSGCHHSLNVPAYVHFTSPIRRYIDLVTHRLVQRALDGAGPCYTESEMTELCTHCTDVTLRTRRFERANLVAHFCNLLMKRPLVLLAIIDRLSDADFQLLFPTIQSFFPSRPKLKLSSLNTSSRPVIGPDSKHLQVTWSQRIYDCHRSEVPSHRHSMMDINADQYTLNIAADSWTELLLGVVDDDLERVTDVVDEISSHLVLPHVNEPTSEGFKANGGQHFAEYALRLRIGGIVMVQLTTELHRGLLRPCIQLFHVTPSTCICVEHIAAAVKCFCKVATKSAARPSYKSVTKYKKLWLPVLAMEAVHGAIANQHSIVIRHVDIRWTQYHMHGEGPIYLATLKLPVSFCEYRCIRLVAEVVNEDDVDDDWSPDPRDDSSSGYVCVRYSDISMPVPPMDLPIDQLVNLGEKLTWVGHCIVSKVLVDKDRLLYTVYLKVHHSSFPLPAHLLDGAGASATIELIDKPLPDR